MLEGSAKNAEAQEARLFQPTFTLQDDPSTVGKDMRNMPRRSHHEGSGGTGLVHSRILLRLHKPMGPSGKLMSPMQARDKTDHAVRQQAEEANRTDPEEDAGLGV